MEIQEPVITLNKVSKTFDISPEKRKSFKQQFINLIKGTPKELPKLITILDNLSLEIFKGEVFGIIGENGAGKSTTLKILSGIIQPDKGTININGTMVALLEIGLGFHPDLTGSENARLYGSILGIPRKIINSRIPDIFKYANLEGFEDVQVKKYSSGMQVRLAFSVATSVDPDILLLDEVFSVGDQAFQEKSFNKIYSYIENGKTVLLVTHDLSVAEKLCSRVLYLKKDGTSEVGKPSDIIQKYKEYFNS